MDHQQKAHQQKESLKIVMEILARYMGGEQTEIERNIQDCYSFYKNRSLLSPTDFLEIQDQNILFGIPQCRYFLKQTGIDQRLLREAKAVPVAPEMPDAPVVLEVENDDCVRELRITDMSIVSPKEKVVCDCGKELLKRSLTSHKKTKRHLALIEKLGNK